MVSFAWFLAFCALLGALVATYIGYRYQYSECGEERWYELCAVYIISVICSIACFGPLDELPLERESLGSVVFIIAVLTVPVLYYKLLVQYAFWGEDLQYPASMRKMRRNKRRHKVKRKVITTRAIARAIRMAKAQEEAKDYENELEKMLFLADGLELIILEPDHDAKSA